MSSIPDQVRQILATLGKRPAFDGVTIETLALFIDFPPSIPVGERPLRLRQMMKRMVTAGYAVPLGAHHTRPGHPQRYGPGRAVSERGTRTPAERVAHKRAMDAARKRRKREALAAKRPPREPRITKREARALRPARLKPKPRETVSRALSVIARSMASQPSARMVDACAPDTEAFIRANPDKFERLSPGARSDTTKSFWEMEAAVQAEAAKELRGYA